LPTRRWFADKSRAIRSVRLRDALPLTTARSGPEARILVVQVEFREGEGVAHCVPVVALRGERAGRVRGEVATGLVLRGAGTDGSLSILADGIVSEEVSRELLQYVRRRRKLQGSAGGRLTGRPTAELRRLLGREESPEPTYFRAEQSNTSVLYGQALL